MQLHNIQCSNKSSISAVLEIEVLEGKGVDGLEQQDEAAQDEDTVADEVVLIAILHLRTCTRVSHLKFTHFVSYSLFDPSSTLNPNFTIATREKLLL